MAVRRSDWPLTVKQLQAVIALGETALVEFKREWWPLGQREGQARLARQVIALANAVGPEELALLVFGVDDERRGSALCSVSDPPQPEAVSQVLGNYIHPAPNIQCRHYEIDGVTVSAIAVLHAPARPHYCIREFPEVLSTRDVYVRRDKQIGVLAPPELEQLIREKDQRLGPVRSLDPVEFGIVTFTSSAPISITVQVRNLTTEPLTDVWIIYDVHSMREPALCYRSRTLSNATLAPGEARESTFSLQGADFYRVYWVGDPPIRKLTHIREQNFVGDRWLDVSATLLFRGGDGFLASRRVTLPLDW